MKIKSLFVCPKCKGSQIIEVVDAIPNVLFRCIDCKKEFKECELETFCRESKQYIPESLAEFNRHKYRYARWI